LPASGWLDNKDNKRERNMTTASDGEILTRVGPGTLLGNMMREYWIPAAASSELVAGGDPMRLMLLGEQLIAFRDHQGRVGIMDHRCPHRCASLFFGRNEKGGLRCAYHGWQFDVEGNCLDMPNVPKHQAFPQRVKARSYRVAERNGLIWTYMGKREVPPPMPTFEPVLLPESEANIFLCSASVIGCRLWKAISIRRISDSCTPVGSRRTSSTKPVSAATPS
jgi:nitrite reductase/ring-hydroxylating ferredoxin subunit